ncbi:hypothetical protein AAFF_G00330780 [Aldrovandia affinis]|uniref:Rho-GAP domain-containing protein n=1 Tax=Aldrovandia affinis TaxID=143900 RepID=A0AAD7VZX9_9TELE|nr:hypothetical protein AAFF_G00330780 [Aldrovandia affinis]
MPWLLALTTEFAGSSGQADLSEASVLPDVAPVVVQRLTEALERQGLESDSLYRMPSGVSGPLELRQALDTGPDRMANGHP